MSNPPNTFNILPATSDCSLSNTSRTFAPTSTIDLTPPPTADGNRDSRKSFNASVVDEIPEEEERGRHGAMSDRMTRTTSHSSIDSDSSDRHLLQTEIDDGKAKRTKIRKFGSIVLYTVYFAVCLAIGAGILISQVMISQIPSQSLFPISHFPFPISPLLDVFSCSWKTGFGLFRLGSFLRFDTCFSESRSARIPICRF